MNVEQVKNAIGKFHEFMDYDANKSLMLSAITSGGGGEWIPQCLLQIAFEVVVGNTHFVRREYGTNANVSRARLDIACINRNTRKIDIAVEIKAPWTNINGMRGKISERGSIAKDIRTLRTYSEAGTPLCIEVIMMVELFLNGEDDFNAPGPKMSLGEFENLSINLWEMKYPTRQDYDPQESQAYIDSHQVLDPLSPSTEWNHTSIGENEFGRTGIWDRCYRLKGYAVVR